MPKTKQPEPLTGKALLAKLDQIPRLSRSQKARECGYYKVLKGGKVRNNLSGLMNAILEAKGIELDSNGHADKRGREATYRVKVHKNGQLLVGSAYTKEMGLKPGDEFEINLGYKHIHLKQISADSEDE